MKYDIHFVIEYFRLARVSRRYQVFVKHFKHVVADVTQFLLNLRRTLTVYVT